MPAFHINKLLPFSATVIFISLFFLINISFGADTNNSTNQIIVAITDFKNLSTVKGYDFLEKTISESLITSLQKSGRIRIVERQRLLSILDEQKMALSGLTEQDISSGKKIGELLGADNLVLGSFSSIGDKIEVNARLVKVDTGEILLAEKISEKMGDDLFNKINELGDTMVIRLFNYQSGFLTLDTFPQGAEVKLDNTVIGTTPITGLKIKTGKYKATVSKKGYDVHNAEFDIQANQKTVMNVQLKQKNEFFYRRFTIQGYPVSFLPPDYQPAFSIGFESFVWNFSLGVEYGGQMFFHSYKDNTAPGKAYQDTFSLYFHRLNAVAKFHLFKEARVASPYIGGGLGWYFGSVGENAPLKSDLYYKAVAGLSFLPSGPFTFYLEALYQNLGTVDVSEKQFNFFGDYNLIKKTSSLENVLLGFGVQFGF